MKLILSYRNHFSKRNNIVDAIHYYASNKQIEENSGQIVFCKFCTTNSNSPELQAQSLANTQSQGIESSLLPALF